MAISAFYHRGRKRAMAMRFLFNERKAAEAAARFLSMAELQSMAFIKLIKLLYLADRKALIETGRTITGDRMVSMENGPVLSRVYDCNKDEPEAGSAWREYISAPHGYDVSLNKEPTFRALSPYELDTINDVFVGYGHLGKWDLVALMHDLPEWKDPDRSALPIDPRTILQEAGKSDAEIERIAEELESLRTFKVLAAGKR